MIKAVLLVLFALVLNGANSSFPGLTLHGTFVYTPFIPQSSLPAFFAELSALNMKIIVVQAVRELSGGCSSTTYNWWVSIAYLQDFFNQADAGSFEVYLGLDLSSTSCALFYESPAKENTIANTIATLQTLQTGGILSRTSLKGFYIPDEPALTVWSLQTPYPYYAAVVNAIRSVKNLPIVVSPYLAGTRLNYVTPTQLANTALAFKTQTGIDIQAWQDSVGADDINIYNRTYNGNALPTVQQYFAALQGVLGTAGLWSDVEAFNWSPTFGAGGGYKPCSIARFTTQLKASSPYVSKRTTWIQQLHFGTVDPNRYAESARLKAAYVGHIVQTKRVYPSSYTYSPAPSPNYPDGANKLFNDITADPINYLDPAWVGVLGAATITVTLPSVANITWVAVHTLCSQGVGIYIPSSIAVRTRTSLTGTWQSQFSQNLLYTQADSEYVIGNNAALTNALGVKQIEITLQNGAWNFISEVEIFKQ